MRTYFVPNALGRALPLILALVIVAVVALVFAGATYAQDVLVTSIPDPGTVIDRLYDGVDGFLQRNDTKSTIGLFAFLIIAGARFILPDTKLDTERIIARIFRNRQALLTQFVRGIPFRQHEVASP